MTINPYWKLYAKIFYIPICRKCGVKLDSDYKKRNRGKLCKNCSPYNEDIPLWLRP